MSYNPITIVNYFIKKHGKNGELTPMKLIKLVYIAYGWYLETFDSERLVNEHPEAWKYGPVFPTLYERLRKYGRNSIKEPVDTDSSDVIKEKDAIFLDKIWDIYGSKNGIYLSALTHQEGTPWSKTYPLGNNAIIDDELIKAHYNSLLQ